MEEKIKHTLNSPKFSNPGSWKEPQLPNWIPERKKLRVKVADMEQKSYGQRGHTRTLDSDEAYFLPDTASGSLPPRTDTCTETRSSRSAYRALATTTMGTPRV